MGLPVCNSTLSDTHWDEDDLVGNFTLHTFGWIVCGFCAMISSFSSFYLVWKHATHYTKPDQQRHIIRILLMIPIYSITSWFSYIWYWHAVYWEVARDCYEAFAIAAFFALLCQYIAPELRTQKEFFATLTPKEWPWPLNWHNRACDKWLKGKGRIKTPSNGLTWFNIIWLGVFQYCFIRVAMTITATATQAAGRYCEDSLSPAFAHGWTLLFNSGAVTIAMYCLIAFYVQLKTDLAPNNPLLKLLCIKLVIFFSFWQMIVLDLLSSAHIVTPTKYLSYGDIQVGINSLLIDVEMIIFSIMHLWAFPWKEYAVDPYTGAYDNVVSRTNVFVGFADAFNPFDTIKAVGRALRWLFVGRLRRREEAEMVIARKESKAYRGPGGRAAPGTGDEGLGLVGNAGGMARWSGGGDDAWGHEMINQSPIDGGGHSYASTSHLAATYSSSPDQHDTSYYSPYQASPSLGNPGHNPAVELRQPVPQRPNKPASANPFADSSASPGLPYPDEDATVGMPSVRMVSASPARRPVPGNDRDVLLGAGSQGSAGSSPSITPYRGRSPAQPYTGGGGGGGYGHDLV